MTQTTVHAVAKALHEASRLLKRRFEDRARDSNLTLPQWRAIHQLAQTDGISQVALAGLIEVTPMTLSGILDRLEARGLVERIADPGDSRAKLVRSTPQSRALADTGRSIRDQILEEALTGMSEAERSQLAGLLEKITGNLTAHEAASKESA